MAPIALLRPFAHVEIFRGLSPLDVEQIMRVSDRISVQAEQIIARTGQPAEAGILIAAGKAILFDERTDEAPVEIGPGSLVSEMAMFIDHAHSATIITATQVRGYRITRAAMQDLMEHNPRIAEHFIDVISSRLKSVAAELKRLEQAVTTVFELESEAMLAN